MRLIWFVIITIAIVVIVYLIRNRFYDMQLSYFTNGNVNEAYANDVSQLNKTKIDKVFYPASKDDIVSIVRHARYNGKRISIRGTQHSMGGQTITQGGYVVDMSMFNGVIDFSPKNMTVTVEPGMSWSQLILYLDPYGLSPMTLQSYSSFSIGGTISVNAHGITNDFGIYNSVLQLGLIDSNGDEVVCSRNANPLLFSLVIGGYGLFGIIIWVKLKLVKNVKLKMETLKLNTYDFHDQYQQILNDTDVCIKMARVNVTNMKDISLYVFRQNSTDQVVSNVYRKNPEMSKVAQLMYKWMMPDPTFQKLRYSLEDVTKKPIDVPSGDLERNLILYESAQPLAKLYSPLIHINATHLLQEFFIPTDSFLEFMEHLRLTFRHRYKYNTLLNITIRYVYRDDITFLNYAKRDMYAFVFYYRLPNKHECDNELRTINQKLIAKVMELGGTFYLPYRHHYNQAQLEQCYPQIMQFFELKKQFDPNGLFSNLWYEKFDKVS